MRELHVVAVSEDGRHVVLAATKSAAKGTYRVRLDARLVSAVRGDLGTAADSDLSPKEIQARLRAGESVEQIARSAGIAITRVERFAGPVAGERAQMIEQARESHVVRGRLGRSAVPLGKVVDAALDEHARPESVAWTARREDDGRWCVQVGWFSRGKNRTASWRYDPHERTVEAVDAASAALGHVDANPATRRTARKQPSAVPAAAMAKPKAPRKSATAPVKVQPGKAKPKEPRKPAAARVKVQPGKAKPKAPRKSAAGPAKVQPGRAKPKAPRTPAKKVPAAPAKVQPRKARTAARAAGPRAAAGAKAASRPRLQVVPDHPAPAPATRPTRAADERDGVKSRASVPAWADVLLGTTPGNDQ